MQKPKESLRQLASRNATTMATALAGLTTPKANYASTSTVWLRTGTANSMDPL